MNRHSSLSRRAGVGIRSVALLIDMGLLWLIVTLVALILNRWGFYLPIELVVLLALPIYSSVLLGWKGYTVGKWVCGLVVLSTHQTPASYSRALWRETFGKFIATMFLLFGFLWVMVSKQKRGWHDYLAGTVVYRDPDTLGRARWIQALSPIAVMICLGFTFYRPFSLYWQTRPITATANHLTHLPKRDPSLLVDVQNIAADQRGSFVSWLWDHGKDPLDYAVTVARQHQLTIFGEEHWRQDNLDFLNRIIPALYHQAGVTCLAMECCVQEDNARLLQLVTAPQFSRNLALTLARNQGWKDWGWKGYWEVFETVSRLNQGLAPGKPKMRVVGIDTRWDGPSWALLGIGDDAIRGPVWEKLRFIRILDDLVLLAKRDELMARAVEKEILEKNDRGIVWVGGEHSYLHYRRPGWVKNGEAVTELARMGSLLHAKYGDRIYQILLHNPYLGNIAHFAEQTIIHGPNRPLGFDVAASPFGSLRDDATFYFRHQPKVCFADLACGYIYLTPLAKMQRCRWLESYISPEMFTENKPYYETKCGLKLNDAQAANQAYSLKFNH